MEKTTRRKMEKSMEHLYVLLETTLLQRPETKMMLTRIKCAVLDFEVYVHESNWKLVHGRIDRPVIIYLYVCYIQPILAFLYWWLPD